MASTFGFSNIYLTQSFFQLSFRVWAWAMVVLMCFNCEHLLVGRTCVEHHTKACCAFGPPTWHHSNSPAPKRGMNLMHRWINCDNCMRQQNLAGRFKTSPFAQLCSTLAMHHRPASLGQAFWTAGVMGTNLRYAENYLQAPVALQCDWDACFVIPALGSNFGCL